MTLNITVSVVGPSKPSMAGDFFWAQPVKSSVFPSPTGYML